MFDLRSASVWSPIQMLLVAFIRYESGDTLGEKASSAIRVKSNTPILPDIEPGPQGIILVAMS
jgi:hypothetical protein